MKPLAQERGVLAEQRECRRVLFVCTGNTCRSPMAAALLNHLCRSQEVCSARGEQAIAPWRGESAGLWAGAGDPISQNAVKSLEQSGVLATPDNDYPAHRARLVTREMMEEADLVVGITARHALELTVRFPECAAKISAFPFDVADPFGGDLALYRECLMQLRFGMTLLLPKGDAE